MRPIAFLVVIALLALAGLPSRSLAADVEAEAKPALAKHWLPVVEGQRWTYRYSRERTRTGGGTKRVVERLRGSRVDEVVLLPTVEADASFAIRTTLRGQSEGAATETVERSRILVDADADTTRVYAREATDPFSGESELARFSPALETLPANPIQGQQWHVGIESHGGIETSIEGEILGVQDARTPSGLYPRCLVVRTRGSHKGSLDLNGTRIELRGGETVTTTWYAAGIGRVLVQEETAQVVAMPDGSDIEFEETVEYALRDASSGDGVVPNRTVAGAANEEQSPAAAAPGSPAPSP